MSRRLKKIGKVLGIALLVLVAIGIAAHFTWKFSGSNEWKLVAEKKGIQVYERKAPGTVFKQFKGIMHVDAKLDSVAALMLDPKVCELEDYGCYESIAVQKVDEQRGGAGLYSFKWRYPGNFQPRHYVIKVNFRQDPKTKEVFETVDAVTDQMPTEEGYVRVSHMRNSWRLTPAGNGRVKIEYIVEAAGGGFMPYFLDNLSGSEYIPFLLSKLPNWLENPKYRNADVAFIAE